MLALRGGWEAGIMNKHTPIMHYGYFTYKRRFFEKKNDSSDDESQHEDEAIEFDPNWNLTWPRFSVLSPVDESEHLTKLSPFAVEKHLWKIWHGSQGTKKLNLRSGSHAIDIS